MLQEKGPIILHAGLQLQEGVTLRVQQYIFEYKMLLDLPAKVHSM